MQELLLLDPIHDVDQTGWPRRKGEGESLRVDLTVSAEQQLKPASGKPPDPAGFFDAVLDVFRRPLPDDLSNIATGSAGKAVLMRFAGPAMAELFSPGNRSSLRPIYGRTRSDGALFR